MMTREEVINEAAKLPEPLWPAAIELLRSLRDRVDPATGCLRLGGLWKGSPDISDEEFRKARAGCWGKLGAIDS